MRRFPVTLGFVASVLVAVGSTSLEYAFTDRWGWSSINFIPDILPSWSLRVILVVGVMGLIGAWWTGRPSAGSLSSEVPWWLVLVLWSVPLLVVPPVMSADAFAYADAGWIVQQGASPYDVGLGGSGGPYTAAVDPQWIGVATAWPPLAMISAWLGASMFDFDPYWGVVGQRVLALIGVLLLALGVPRVAEHIGSSKDVALWLACLNPIVLIHYVGGAHVDGLALGLVVIAWWVASRAPGWPGFIIGAVLVGVAMSLKQYTGLAVVGVAAMAVVRELGNLSLIRRVLLLGARSALAALLAVGVFVGAAFATGLGFGWTGQMATWYNVIGTDYPIGHLLTLVPSFVLGDIATLIAAAFGVETLWFYQAAVVVCAATGGVALCALFVRYAHQPWRFMGWAGLIVALSTQQLHPWYLGFGAVALGLGSPSERGLRAVVFALSGYIVAYFSAGLPRMAFLIFVACTFLMWACHKVFGRDGRLTAVEISTPSPKSVQT